MGVIENEVFLSMEDTLAAKVRVAVMAAIGPDIATAAKLLGQGQFDAARAVVDGFDVSQELLPLEGMIRTKFIQNALFGASQLTEPEASILMTEPHLLDPISNMILQHNAIINQGIAKVQSIAHRMITQAEEGEQVVAVGDGIIKSWGGHVHLHKAGESITELAVLFNNAVDGNMNALVDLGANLTTSRMISYGFLQEAHSVGILSYEVSAVLDDRTCPACEFIHGTVFAVEKALARTTEVLNITDPAELRSAAPFVDQSKAGLADLREMSADDLAAEGFDVPPYHPLCRCILVELGREIGTTTVDIFDRRPRPPVGSVTQTPRGPRVVQPPKPSVVPPAVPETPYSTASNWFKRFNDPNTNVNRIVGTFDDPAIKAQVVKVNKQLQGVAGKETNIIHKTADGAWTAERKALHKKIIREHLTVSKVAAATPEAGVAPKYITLGGRAGSGKSFLSKSVAEGGVGAFDKTKFILLDSDAIKLSLKEFKGWNAAQVHAESSEIMERITRLAHRKRLNVVHDGTMSGLQKTTRRITRFGDAGYELEGYYVFVPPQESARRAIFRWINDGDGGPFTGRYVPTEFVLKMTDNEEVWDALSHLFSKWKFYDNQKIGGKPRLVASGEKPFIQPVKPVAPPRAKWTNVATVDDGIEQLKSIFGSDYLFERGRRANRRMGGSLSDSATVKQMNAIGEDLADLQNRFGFNFGNKLNPMNRNPSGRSWGAAKTPLNPRGAEHLGDDGLGNIDRRLLLRNPKTKKFKDLDSLKTYRNKYDKPWSVWVYEQEASKWSTTFRHEMGHTWTTRETFDKMEEALATLGKPFLEKMGSDGRFIGKDKAVAGGLEWMKANVGEYSGSKVVEAISETFARVTAPNYIRGSLPKVLEDVVDDMLGYIKSQGTLI